MSRFSEGMIEDGFSDPMEYMDHLERKADEWSSEMNNFEDEENYEDDEDKKHSDHIDRWLCKQIVKVQEIEEEFTRLWDQRVELVNIDEAEYDLRKQTLFDKLETRINYKGILARKLKGEDVSKAIAEFDSEFLKIENEVHLEVNPLIEKIDERLKKLKFYYHSGKDFSYPELQREDLMFKNPVSDFLLKFEKGDKVCLNGRYNNAVGIISGFNWQHGGIYVISDQIKFQNPIHPMTDPDIRIEFA